MTEELPAPPVPENADVRSMPFTPMYRARLFGSAFHSKVSDAGWRAGVTLWLKSWDQAPPGSLPDDDTELCRLAELGRDLKTWRKLRSEALWGWFKCSDGRLYHEVVAEGVNQAWQSVIKRRDRTEAARTARLSQNKARPVTASNLTEQNKTESPQAPRDAGLSQSRRRTSTFGLKPIGSIPKHPVEISWPARIETWRRVKLWQPDWGPSPDQPGCEAPPEFMPAVEPVEEITPAASESNDLVPKTAPEGIAPAGTEPESPPYDRSADLEIPQKFRRSA